MSSADSLSTMSARVIAAVCAIAALGMTLAACGEDDRGGSVQESGGTSTTGTGTETTGTSTTPVPSGAAVKTVKVRETEFALDPENPDVARAGVVSFQVTNGGKVLHALEVEGPNGEVKTKGINPGGSATLKADLSKPGKYEWYCPIADHKDRGMKGTITVAGGGSGTSTDDSGDDDSSTEDSSKDDSSKDGDSRSSGGSSGKSSGGGAGGY
jgi:uncharacterized cupredoxin-like copper-binding protein